MSSETTITLELSAATLESLLRRRLLHLEELQGADQEAHKLLQRLAKRCCICDRGGGR